MKKGIFIIMVLAILTLCILPVMAENVVPLVPELTENLDSGVFTLCEYNSRAELQSGLVLVYLNSLDLMSDNIEYSCITNRTRFNNDNNYTCKNYNEYSEVGQEPQIVFRWPNYEFVSVFNNEKFVKSFCCRE